MESLVTQTKIEKIIDMTLNVHLENLMEDLLLGDLKSFEQNLWSHLTHLYNQLSELFLCLAAVLLLDKMKGIGKSEKGCKLKKRRLSIRLSTGYLVKVESYYVKKLPKTWDKKKRRHLLADYWHLIGNASPLLYDRVGFCSVISSSYELGYQTLTKLGAVLSLSSFKKIANQLAIHCKDKDEASLQLKPQESLADKRVVISIDGGRVRRRKNKEKRNKSGNLIYDTKWKEPKLLVIDVLDENGQPSREELPIYGCRFKKKDFFVLLEDYLEKLEIDKAVQVQILADGAPWIWNNTKESLLKLGVNSDKIIETLDYYHASKYIYALVEKMPKRISEKQKKQYLQQFKQQLWEGQSDTIVKTCQTIYKRPSKVIKQYIEYLDKHQEKTQYADFQENKLMCGSGIIESGIRRVVNLRFKNASSFWKKENVEKMLFLRGVLMANRWDILMQNLNQ